MTELPTLIRRFIAQLCSEEFLIRWERHGGERAKVDVVLYGANGRTIEAKPPTIIIHQE